MKKKILIVDDDVAIVEFLKVALEAEPYELFEAFDGKEALEKALQCRPDLVVLDLMMPKMHGFQVCQRLRADERHKGVKILITSSKSYAADLEHAKSAGADGYLTKPYNYKEMISTIRSMIGDAPSAPPPPTDQLRRTPVPTPNPRRVTPVPSRIIAGGAQNAIKVRFWGTRGSSPAPGPTTIRYGGNTACTELRIAGQIFIIDAGTGLRELGLSLMDEFQDRPIVAEIFVGHTHWDHIQGFPFFSPLYIPRNQFTVHSVRAAGKSLEKVFRGQMAADYFPVPLQSMASALQFSEVDDSFAVGDVKVTYHFLNHPGVAIGFRFEYGGKSVTYLSDHEPFGRLNTPSDITRRQDAGIVEFCRNTDLLICEAQYTEEEYKIKKGWGHSTFDDAVDRAVQSGCKQMAIFHHDPTHNDAMMDRFVTMCQNRVKDSGSRMTCFGAQEGQGLVL